MSVDLKEFRVSNDAMHDPEELQRRVDDEGYLFFKRLVRSRQTVGICAAR